MEKHMKKLLVLASLALLPLTAAAHGPSPQKVEKTVTIKAEPAKVWAIIKDFGTIDKWHPAVASSKLEKKGSDTYRQLKLKDGGSILEKLRSIDDQSMQLKYEIVESTLPFTDYYAVMKVEQGANANETNVTWMGRFYRVYKLNPPIPEGQDDATAVAAVTGIYDAGLANLKKVAEGK
jgi:hypothetical protein